MLQDKTCVFVWFAPQLPPSVIYISRRSDNLKQRYGTSDGEQIMRPATVCLTAYLSFFFYLPSRRFPPPALCWTLSAELTERHVGSAAEKLKCNFKGVFDVFFSFLPCTWQAVFSSRRLLFSCEPFSFPCFCLFVFLGRFASSYGGFSDTLCVKQLGIKTHVQDCVFLLDCSYQVCL